MAGGQSGSAFVAVAAQPSRRRRAFTTFAPAPAAPTDFAQFHIWLTRPCPWSTAHDVVDEIEAELHKEFPGVEVIIHVDPEGHVDQPDNPLAERDETLGISE